MFCQQKPSDARWGVVRVALIAIPTLLHVRRTREHWITYMLAVASIAAFEAGLVITRPPGPAVPPWSISLFIGMTAARRFRTIMASLDKTWPGAYRRPTRHEENALA